MLGSLSRRTIRINGALFCLLLLLGELLGAPKQLGPLLLLSRGRDYDANAAVFSLTFYGVIFPLIVQTVLVLLPSLWGMRQGLRLVALPLPLQTILWASAIASVTALGTENSLWWQLRTWDVRPLLFPRVPSLAPLALMGPVGHMVATASWRYWRGKTASD